MKAYKEITDVIFDLDAVAALLNALSVQYMEEEQRASNNQTFRFVSY